MVHLQPEFGRLPKAANAIECITDDKSLEEIIAELEEIAKPLIAAS